jgi:OOP family OmpA-OmpF porin
MQLQKKKIRFRIRFQGEVMQKYLRGTLYLPLLWLASCTTAKLEELRQISPHGTLFQIALAREYLAFSESEATQYDWIDSYHFADKGLRAAYGQDVAPESPEAWDIPAQSLPELQAAFTELNTLLNDSAKNVKEAKPDITARAQYFYDCWVEQQEEAWQLDDIAECKDGFHAAMQDLGNQGDVTPSAPRSTAYMLFFDFNEAILTAEGQRVLMHVVDDRAQAPDLDVVLHGHTDTSGKEGYNLTLSEKRAQAVRRFLIKGGIPAAKISYYAFGETDLRVTTEDGVKEPANRRVEIFLEPLMNE